MIFEVTKTTCGEAETLVTNADKLANRAFQMLLIFAVIIDGIPKTLKALKKAIQTVITLNKNVIRGLRNNPAIRGPWKIIALVFAGILTGVGVVLKALKGLVVALLNSMRGTALRKLKRKIKGLREKLLKYAPISAKIGMLLSFLKGLSGWLEQNEKHIDPEDKVLYPQINNDQLKEIRKNIRKLNDILAKANGKIDEIEKKVDEISAFLKSVNPIIALSAAVANGINSVLGGFNQIFQKIKEFISNIPGIGWLLSKLDYFIDKALEVLGIKTLLKRLGTALGGLPFFSSVRNFLKDLKAMVDAIISQVQELIDFIEEKIKELEKLKLEAAEILAIFLAQNIPKNIHEIMIPESVLMLLEQANAALALAKKMEEQEVPSEEDQEELSAHYNDIRNAVKKVVTMNSISPALPFNRQHQVKLDGAMAKFSLGKPREFDIENEELSFREFVTEQVGNTSKNLKEIKIIYKKAMPEEFDRAYYNEGIRYAIQAQTEPVITEFLYGEEGAYARLGIFTEDRTPHVEIKEFDYDDEKYDEVTELFS